MCGAARGETPTFARDIAPVLYQKCAACHHAGGAGPFPLLSYDDAKKHARQIAAVTASGFMPPWPPQKGYGDFQDERSLTREQVQLIEEWVKAGAPEGDTSNLPKAPSFQSGWQLGQPDLVLKTQRGFTVPAGGPDVFWNFVFKPELETSAQGDCGPLCAASKTRYIRALEIRPNGSAGGRNVHHANLIVDRMGSLVRQKVDLQNGFPGMDLVISENPFDPAGHLLFWTAGSIPTPEPDDMPWRLDPGNLLVLNTHMQPSGKTEIVQPEIGLYFTDKPPTRFPLVIEMEDDDALNIPPGAKDFSVSDDFQLPVDTEILAIRPHAHYLGKVLEAYATLPDKTRKWLIRIPDWNPDWQETYRYKQPVFLPKGSVISMRYSYDNSSGNPRNPNHPPKRVQAGNRAMDEMSHLWLQILPVGAGDRRRAVQEALARHKLAQHPNDFSAQLNLGAILMSRLDMQGAVSALKQAVRIDPTRPDAHDMLGSAMLSLGFGSEAKQQFELALGADPNYINARYNLARALARERKFGEAAAQFERVARAFPNSARIQDEYGVLLAQSGRRTEALKQFDAALAIDPSYDDARKNRDELTRQSAARTR
jgi:tetratricopeptide (TPR) repeat protein